MQQRPPVRHPRPLPPNRPPRRYDRRRPQPPAVRHRRGSAYRRPRRHRSSFGLGMAAVIILCVILFFLFSPKKQLAQPVNGPAELSSAIDPSQVSEPSTISSEISSAVDAEYERAYEVASQVRLINFDHPNYDEPEHLVSLNELLPDCVTINSGANRLEEPAAKALKELFEAAEADGITTYIVNSAWRDRETQQSFWNNRLAQDPSYGDDVYANPVKTVPATASEHCTGLAVDILCDSVPHGTSDYQDTAEAKWLAQHAHEYGFILRYPDKKQSITGVMYEAWHYRYVGKEAAADIHASGLCLEEYLASFGLPEENPAS